MNITIINDCRDANAVGRQIARTTSLFDSPVSFVGVTSDIQAAGNIIDILDAIEESPGIILVNVAPRNGKAKKWENGTPFGYFWYKNILVLASIDGLTLSLVKKLNLTEFINILDVPTSLGEMIAADFIPKNKAAKSTRSPIEEFETAPQAIWWIDNFGNCKTTVLPEEINVDAQ